MKKSLIAVLSGLALTGCNQIQSEEEKAILAGKEVVIRELRDPESAQFRDVFYAPPVEGLREDGLVCGEFNGKNLNGAYVGFTAFIANPVTGGLSVSPSSNFSSAEAAEIGDLCTTLAAEYEARGGEVRRFRALDACQKSVGANEQIVKVEEFKYQMSSVCKVE